MDKKLKIQFLYFFWNLPSKNDKEMHLARHKRLVTPSTESTLSIHWSSTIADHTWFTQEPQSEVDVVFFVCLSVSSVGIHVDNSFSTHVKQETWEKITFY